MISKIILALALILSIAGFANADEKKGTLIAFKASWCAACNEMEPTLRRIEKRGYKVVRVDVDTPEGARQAKARNVKELPTFIVVDDTGREQGREVGVVTEGALIAILRIVGKLIVGIVKIFFL